MAEAIWSNLTGRIEAPPECLGKMAVSTILLRLVRCLYPHREELRSKGDLLKERRGIEAKPLKAFAEGGSAPYWTTGRTIPMFL